MEFLEVILTLTTAASLLYLLLAFRADLPRLDAGERTEGSAEQSERSAVAIRELDFDFAAGKLSREDHDSIRGQIVSELAESLKNHNDSGHHANLRSVIPAKAGIQHVVNSGGHPDPLQSRLDSRFRGNDGSKNPK
ncbi:hypothetical protein HY522_05665 [bacterium]|nr:hypothetical protein [bacterium]